MQSDCSKNSNLDQQKSVKDFKLVPSGIIETVEELEKSGYVGIFCFGEKLQYVGFLAHGGAIFSMDTGRYLAFVDSLPAIRLEVTS